ncbi:MAG: family NAD(P)-dependent oxidoreductase [Dehalococcoidia bacterium]|nr:family NAD(P)-dependent oxidoreductase [Dehalococcoidia bacterium]
MEGKVAMVTGASRGIGKATALALARRGADVVVVARSEAPSDEWPGSIHEIAEEVRALGRRALAVKVDVTIESDVERAVESAWAEFGRLDILVNNAGVLGDHRGFMDVTPEYWDSMMSVNLRGIFLCARAVAPLMISAGGGTIINVSSGASTRTGFLSLPYGVSKAALDRFTLGLAEELKEHKIAVVSYHPPFTVTPGTLRVYDEQRLTWAQPVEAAGEAIAAICANNPLELTGQALSRRQLVEKGVLPWEG